MKRYFVIVVAIVSLLIGAIAQSQIFIVRNAAALPTTSIFSTPGFTTTTVPIGAQWADVWVFSAGGGAGSGRRGATGSVRTGGVGGQSGAALRQNVSVATLGGVGATIPIIVGAGGTGAAAVTVDSTNGNPGNIGGSSGLGSVLQIGNAGTGTITNAVVFTLSEFIQVGGSGLILTSSSGTGGWTSQTSGTANTLNGVCSNGTTVVAVGVSGTIITSTNGTVWTTRTSNTANQLNACAWNGTSFIAVGNSSTIDTSPDGVTWTVNAFAAGGNINDVAYDGTTNLVAVDSNGNAITATTATGTWTAAAITASSSYGLNAVAFGSGTWLTVGINGINYRSTTPAGSWTVGGNLSNSNSCLRFSNGYFFTSASGGLVPVLYSSDAINWNYTVTPFVSGIGVGSGCIANGAGVWAFTKRTDNAALPTQAILYLSAISAYSIQAVGGGGGIGGSTAAVAGSVNNTGMFTTGPSAGSTVTGAGQSVGFGVCVGGPGGGGSDATNTQRLGGFGSQPTLSHIASIANPGVSGGALPGNGVSITGSDWTWGGSSGGGGSHTTAAAGQPGGTSGSPCAGGAGGSGSDNGNNSGAGSNGGNGEVRIIWHYGN